MTTTTITEEPKRKARNGERIPAAVADLPQRQQRTFENDYQRVTRPGAPFRDLARAAGRNYVAVGWRMYRDAISGRGRVRKGPDECRDPLCPCIVHRRTKMAAALPDDRQLNMCGFEGQTVCEQWPNCEHVDND